MVLQQLTELKTNNIEIERLAAELGIDDPDEIQELYDMDQQRINGEEVRCDYYYDVYLKQKRKRDNQDHRKNLPLNG